MSLPSIIAIDGPAASGKSTLALRVAQKLDYLFFDTGVMYRAITWMALQQHVPVDDEAAVTRLAEQAQIDVRPPSVVDGRTSDVLIDGQDITWEVRNPQVDAHVSTTAAFPGVRLALTKQQRRVGQRGRVVMVGRDIGTVVLPEADLKIYLDASAEQRARRRYDELIARDQTADYSEILSSMRQRDHTDANREIAPLRPAEDALILNSNHLDADQVVDVVLHWVKTGAGHRPILDGQIALVTVLADDLQAMLRFYRDTLGFQPLNEMDGFIEFEHAGVRFALCAKTVMLQTTRHPSYQENRGGQSFELALPAASPEDVDRLYIELLARGAAPICPPAAMPWGQHVAFFADPDGNIHEIFADLNAGS
jgi:CMP/dCMP kinase